MKITWLTPENKNQLDPRGTCYEKITRALRNGVSHFNAPSPYYKDNTWEIMMPRLKKMWESVGDKHSPLIQYETEMLSKVGPQGGMMPGEKLKMLISEYYNRASIRRDFTALHKGRDYLIRIIKGIISNVGYPQYTPAKVYSTFAGIPSGSHKGSFSAETEGFKPWRHMFPAVPGQRRQRGKDRVIFMDATPNVRYIEQELNAVRNWLRTYIPQYFGSWLNPSIQVRPAITQAVNHRMWFAELDYEGMDMNFSLELVQEIIIPIYRELLPGSTLAFEAAIEELFSQPLFMGDYMIEGIHSLFSGEVITNDFETIYSVVLYLSCVLEMLLVDELKFKLEPQLVSLFLGDDMLASFKMQSQAEWFVTRAIEISNSAGMIIHPLDSGKTRIQQSEARYLRCVYYPSSVRDVDGYMLGAYPSVLALNNMLFPERQAKTSGIQAVADLQRLDNCYGTPYFHVLVDMMMRYSLHKFVFTEADVTQAPVDWWERVYGERWDPTSSRAYQHISLHHSR